MSAKYVHSPRHGEAETGNLQSEDTVRRIVLLNAYTHSTSESAG